MKLGSVNVSGINWIEAAIEVMPQEDIYAIVIGPPCAPTLSNESTYYFFDDLILADQQLVLKQYLATVAGGGDEGRIAQAEGNMSDAQAKLANGEYALAVLDYKKAWVNLIKAK